MKKSTLLVLVMAVGLGAWVYFREYKKPPETESSETKTTPAFHFSADAVTGLVLTRSGQAVTLEKRGGDWFITAPLETEADRSVVEGILEEAASAAISRTIAPAPGQPDAFGLKAPAVTLDISLKDKSKHRLVLGDKDFSGASAYAIVDGAKDIALLPAAVLGAADKPLDELRDRSVLSLDASGVTGFTLRNASGEIVAAKRGSDWKLTKPRALAGDSGEITSLLAQIASAKWTKVESETPADLGKYGLANPAITFTAVEGKGGKQELAIGKKADGDYFARDTSRGMLFRINETLEKKLSDKLFDLRDKSLAHVDAESLARVEVKNSNGTLAFEKQGEKWIFRQPAAEQGKEAQSWRFLDPVGDTRATSIFDSPNAEAAAALAKPAIQITFVGKDGKTTKVEISAVKKDSVYVRTAGQPTVYQAGKQLFDDLNFKANDLEVPAGGG